MKNHQPIIIRLMIVFLVGCICSCTRLPPTDLPRTHAIPITHTQHIIYFVYRDWHTSLVVDAQQLGNASPKLAADLQGEKYARIGWGDGDYFTGKNKSLSSATKALALSHYSALQLLTYNNESLRDIPSETIVPLALDDEGLHRLLNYINASLSLDERGAVIRLPSINSDTGIFFKATGHYSLFSNCNTWSGQALRVAGLPVASRLTAQGVFGQAQAISRFQAQAGVLKGSVFH